VWDGQGCAPHTIIRRSVLGWGRARENRCRRTSAEDLDRGARFGLAWKYFPSPLAGPAQPPLYRGPDPFRCLGWSFLGQPWMSSSKFGNAGVSLARNIPSGVGFIVYWEVKIRHSGQPEAFMKLVLALFAVAMLSLPGWGQNTAHDQAKAGAAAHREEARNNPDRPHHHHKKHRSHHRHHHA